MLFSLPLFSLPLFSLLSLLLYFPPSLKGFAPHVSPFTELQDVGSLLTRAGYTLTTLVSLYVYMWWLHCGLLCSPWQFSHIRYSHDCGHVTTFWRAIETSGLSSHGWTTCCLASFGFYILYNKVCLSPARINDTSGTSEDFVQRLTSWQNHAALIDDNSPHKPIPWSCGSSQLQMGDKLLPEPSAHGPPWLMWSSHDWPLATLDLSCDHTRHTCISTWSCSAPQDVDEIQVNYPSMFELIHDLKGLLLR